MGPREQHSRYPLPNTRKPVEVSSITGSVLARGPGGAPRRRQITRPRRRWNMTPQRNGETPSELADWRDRTRVFLQPIAAPSILGLFGFALSTFMVSAQLDGWYGTPRSGMFLFPFAVAAGGGAPLAAAPWGGRGRGGPAPPRPGPWGSVFVGFGGP